MPSKFRLKAYIAGGYYHIYNQGIDKRQVFVDDADYQYFLQILKTYLSPKDQIQAEIDASPFRRERPYRSRHRLDMNLQHDITLFAYCLMPTYFNLLLRQQTTDAITKLMRRLCTTYVGYFNKKYHRAGNLFEGVYRAESLTSEQDVYSLVEKIHLSPISVKRVGLISASSGSAETYPYSSYHIYISDVFPDWLHKVVPSVQ